MYVAAAAAVGAVAFATWKPAPQQAAPWTAPSADEMPQAPAKGEPTWTDKPQGLPVRLSKKGIASQSFGTLPSNLVEAAKLHGNRPALCGEKRPYPDGKFGEWTVYTWNDYLQQSRRFAKALLSLGHKPFDAVAICAFNHPEWHIAHMGSNFAGGMSAGTYITNSPAACAFVAQDSGSVVVVVDTMANANKYISKRSELPKVQHVVVFQDDIPEASRNGGYVVSWQEFLAKGDSVTDAQLDARTATLLPQHCASLIYTSGTTGNPKGVMISHDAILFAGQTGIASMALAEIEHHVVSYLPLSHIAAQMLDMSVPAVYAAKHGRCVTVYFARPDVLRGTLPITLKAVRPTYFFGVPRVWEKIVEGIKAKSKAAPATGLKLKLVTWARDVGQSNSRARQCSGDGQLRRGTHLAEKLVFSKVLDALGFDRCLGFYSGAAPIAKETLEFLASLNINVCEVYGMSETCGLGTSSALFRFQFGSCGFRSYACELKIDHEPTRDKPGEGEICFRGRHVMMGYLNNPEKTREVIDNDGWLHSGDVGRFDAFGMLYITGRIKELIIGAGGENIAPVPIEYELKRLLPAVSNCVLIGDKRKFLTMLFTPKLEPDFATGGFKDKLVAESADVDKEAKTAQEAARSAAWQAYIQKGIDAYNKGPACISNAQKVQKFVLLAGDLSLAGGELTATMKLKRNVVVEKYASEIEGMYASAEGSP